MRMFTLSILFSLLAVGVITCLPPRGRRWRAALFAVAIVGLSHLGWWAERQALLEGTWATAVRLVSTICSVTALVCVVAGVPFLLGRAIASRLARKAPAVDVERRRFLGGAAVPLLGLTTGAGGTVGALRGFRVVEEEIEIAGLPPTLDGFRIGQISDVHVGPFIGVDHLLAAVEAMNRAGTDLQVMTGDLLDDLSQLEATMDALDACIARHGMLAVIGNHEIWRGEAEIRAAYERRAARGGVRLLFDESVRLDVGGTPLRVVGVDYPMIRGGRHRLPAEARFALMRRSAERAFAQVEPGETILCLSHHPDFFRIAAARGAHLTLAGHTHGGQVALAGFPIFRSAYEFMLGRYRLGDAHLYVSGGTGHWFPYRLGVPAEVTILTLRSAASRPARAPARA